MHHILCAERAGINKARTRQARSELHRPGCSQPKTSLIVELLSTPTLVTLWTRPRRFGKTLNLSMLGEIVKERPPRKERLHLLINAYDDVLRERELTRELFGFYERTGNWASSRRLHNGSRMSGDVPVRFGVIPSASAESERSSVPAITPISNG